MQFLCNFLRCGDSCGFQSDDQMLNVKDEKVHHHNSMQYKKKLDISAIKKQTIKSISVRNNNTPFTQSKKLRPFHEQPSTFIQKIDIKTNKHSRHQSDLQAINPNFMYPNKANIKKQNEKIKFIYPFNHQSKIGGQNIKNNVHQKCLSSNPMSYRTENCTILSGSRTAQLSSLETTRTGKSNSFVQEMNITYNCPVKQQYFHSSNRHVQSSDNLHTFQGPIKTPQNRLAQYNRYVINVKKEEQNFSNFVILENNESALSLNEDSSKLIKTAKNSTSLPIHKNNNSTDLKNVNNFISSIKLINQTSKKRKQVRFQAKGGSHSSQKDIQKQQTARDFFRVVDTTKSIDSSASSWQQSYLDLKFMNNLSSKRLFSKLM